MPVVDGFGSLMNQVEFHGRGAAIRAHIALVNSSLSYWTDAHPQDDLLQSALRDLEAHKAGAPVGLPLREHLRVLEPMWHVLTRAAGGKSVEHWRHIYVLERVITGLRWALKWETIWVGAYSPEKPLSDEAARSAVAAELLPVLRREGDPLQARVAARQR